MCVIVGKKYLADQATVVIVFVATSLFWCWIVVVVVDCCPLNGSTFVLGAAWRGEACVIMGHPIPLEQCTRRNLAANLHTNMYIMGLIDNTIYRIAIIINIRNKYVPISFIILMKSNLTIK